MYVYDSKRNKIVAWRIDGDEIVVGVFDESEISGPELNATKVFNAPSLPRCAQGKLVYALKARLVRLEKAAA